MNRFVRRGRNDRPQLGQPQVELRECGSRLTGQQQMPSGGKQRLLDRGVTHQARHGAGVARLLQLADRAVQVPDRRAVPQLLVPRRDSAPPAANGNSVAGRAARSRWQVSATYNCINN